MKKIYLILLLIIPICSFSQNIIGYWTGNLTQASGGIASNYPFSVDIKSNVNGIYSGTTKIGIYTDRNVYGKMSFTGTFDGQVFSFTEIQILNQDKQNGQFSWCIKTADLDIYETSDSLILMGQWRSANGMSCAPGKIRITKPKIVNSSKISNRKTLQAKKGED